MTTTTTTTSNRTDNEFDVLVICDERLEELVSNKFEGCFHDILYTINVRDILPGTSLIDGFAQQVSRSTNVLIVNDDGDSQLSATTKYRMDVAYDIYNERKYGLVIYIDVNQLDDILGFLAKSNAKTFDEDV